MKEKVDDDMMIDNDDDDDDDNLKNYLQSHIKNFS